MNKHFVAMGEIETSGVKGSEKETAKNGGRICSTKIRGRESAIEKLQSGKQIQTDGRTNQNEFYFFQLSTNTKYV